MLRSTIALAALAAAPIAHADEVTDVLLLPGEQQLWIALDGQPERLEAQSAHGSITLTLNGFQALNARTIIPAAGVRVAGIVIEPDPAGTVITIEGGFGVAGAELRQGGVLIDLSGGAYRVAAAQPSPSGVEMAPAEHPTAMSDAAPHLQSEASSGAERAASEPVVQSSQNAPYRIAAEGEVHLAEQAAVPPGESQPASSTPPGAVEAASTLRAQEPGVEVDVTSVPGETELVDAEPELPGPCDPTAAMVASSPWDLDALAAHAACLIGIGETVNGAGLYERVLAFDPGHFQAALGLARLREQQGRRADAARLFETAADAALTDGQALAARQSARRMRNEN